MTRNRQKQAKKLPKNPPNTRRCYAKDGKKKAETTRLDWGGLLVKLNLTI